MHARSFSWFHGPLLFFSVFSVVTVVCAGVDKFPQRTEDARTLLPDVQEIRFGYAQWEEDGGPELREATASYSRGFAGGLELGLGLPWVDSDPSQGKANQGLGDLRLYGELSILEFIFSDIEKPVDGISLALTLHMEGLESDKDLGRHDKTSEFTMNWMKDLRKCIAHVSFGWPGTTMTSSAPASDPPAFLFRPGSNQRRGRTSPWSGRRRY